MILSQPKIVQHQIDTWNMSDGLAYTDLRSGEIHILSPQSMYDFVLEHEKLHFVNRRKWYSWIAAFNNIGVLLILLSVVITGALMQNLLIVLFFSGVMMLIMGCYFYVERYVPVKELDKNGKN